MDPNVPEAKNFMNNTTDDVALGHYLVDGMTVAHLNDPNHRWMTIKQVTKTYGKLHFIGTYDDGIRAIHNEDLSTGWFVKIDNPPKKEEDSEESFSCSQEKWHANYNSLRKYFINRGCTTKMANDCIEEIDKVLFASHLFCLECSIFIFKNN